MSPAKRKKMAQEMAQIVLKRIKEEDVDDLEGSDNDEASNRNNPALKKTKVRFSKGTKGGSKA